MVIQRETLLMEHVIAIATEQATLSAPIATQSLGLLVKSHNK